MHVIQPGAYVRITHETKEKLLLPVEITENAQMSRMEFKSNHYTFLIIVIQTWLATDSRTK